MAGRASGAWGVSKMPFLEGFNAIWEGLGAILEGFNAIWEGLDAILEGFNANWEGLNAIF